MDIQKILSELTLEEKAGLCSGSDFWHTKAVGRLGIPAIMMSDGPHGLRKQDLKADHLGVNESIRAVCFPSACATAASFDRTVMRAIGEAIGDSCQHEEVAVILGPGANLKRSPLCGRNFEYISEDPFLAGEMAVPFIQGVQSRGVGTSLKHFAANNQEHRRMSSSSQIDERTLRELYLPAFEKAVKQAQPWTVMCSYNALNGTMVNENAWLLTEVLRNEWGFEGLVVSDWGAVSDRVRGIAAGMDLEMPSSGGMNDRKIVEAVRAGKLAEADVDRACERVLALIDKACRLAKPETAWDLEAQHRLAEKIAEECIVLLKNEDGLLPFRKEDSIALIGAFARRPRYQGGGSSHINSFRVTGALEAAQGLNVRFAEGYSAERDEATEAQIQEAVQAARSAHAAVVFAGLPDSYESEGYDRKHMRLPDCQNRLIAAVAAANPNTVVVLHNGSPVEMPWVHQVKGIVEAYLGGQAVGEAVIRVLFGEVNPSGHLAETFPVRLQDNPSFLWYGGEGDATEYREGIFVGYRYYDKTETPVLFPFGHGLSYTTFAYSGLRLSRSSILDTETVTVSVRVKNTGSRAGKAVAQLYVSDLESDVLRPVRELKGFEKTALEPGEEKEIVFTLDRRAFAYWNTQIHDWFVETGDFRIEIGSSSRDLCVSETLHVESTGRLPRRYGMNTIVMDLMKDPRAKEILDELFRESPAFGGLDESEASEASREAISEEMILAMTQYMPLRSLVSFAGDKMTPERMRWLEEKLKELSD